MDPDGMAGQAIIDEELRRLGELRPSQINTPSIPVVPNSITNLDFSPGPGDYENDSGAVINVNVASYHNGQETLMSVDGTTAYQFDKESGTLTHPMDTGVVNPVCPDCYVIGGGTIKAAWSGLTSWAGRTFGARVGERLFLSETFGITSARFSNSAAHAPGALNVTGSFFKIG